MNEATQRPEVGVAHVVLETDQMEASCQFMRTIGMRSVFEGPEVSVFELRGGTHLLVMAKAAVTGGDAAFDLMVDDIHASREKFAALGLNPSPIEPRPQIDHDVFTVREPAGHVITVFSSHVIGAF
ncbi:MAG: VOC family protein [bacterium]|nr:VOC family protein [bacterium]